MIWRRIRLCLHLAWAYPVILFERLMGAPVDMGMIHDEIAHEWRGEVYNAGPEA